MWNNTKTLLLMAVLTGLFVAAGWALGGEQMAVFGLFMAGIMNVGSYFFSDKIVLRMYRARLVSRQEAPEFHEIVERLARKAGLPMPKVAILPQAQPNAFATGRNPEHAVVAATEGILKMLTREELEGVMAHELAHVKNRDMLIGTIAATLAGALSHLAYMSMWGGRDREGGSNALGLVMMLLAPLGAMLIQMAISRSREFGADAGGAEISGRPRALASALQKLEAYAKRVPMDANPATTHLFIVNPLRGGGMASLFSTHPSTAKRVERLMQMQGVG
ncbi:MAG: zinc metalloprotease HtpX [Gemmatimonadetes bacterium]|nr:zinc metalloprotease HtpX [Gemmatimonadota bacterium]